jgi:hypothetical protein
MNTRVLYITGNSRRKKKEAQVTNKSQFSSKCILISERRKLNNIGIF